MEGKETKKNEEIVKGTTQKGTKKTTKSTPAKSTVKKTVRATTKVPKDSKSIEATAKVIKGENVETNIPTNDRRIPFQFLCLKLTMIKAVIMLQILSSI